MILTFLAGFLAGIAVMCIVALRLANKSGAPSSGGRTRNDIATVGIDMNQNGSGSIDAQVFKIGNQEINLTRH
jgi:hypothetical protein